MILQNEQWFVWNGTELILATQEQIDAHFAHRQSEDNFWGKDYS
jgi:hypothetical protein